MMTFYIKGLEHLKILVSLAAAAAAAAEGRKHTPAVDTEGDYYISSASVSSSHSLEYTL